MWQAIMSLSEWNEIYDKEEETKTFGGLMAVDIAPKNASGAALGVVGVASYVGAGIQDIMSGLLIEGNKHLVNGVETYDFTYINYFWIGAALMSVLMTCIVWKAKPKTV